MNTEKTRVYSEEESKEDLVLVSSSSSTEVPTLNAKQKIE